ncbi:MAG TPA: DUF1425 domain-containing protein [Tepidisphaeraceae bacterium]|nr:DUF1425 domain-containing protein [Tepidisphaeraceae bacterium]
MKKTTTFMVAALLSLTAAACNEVKPPIQGRADPFDAQQVHFATESLRKDTAVGTPLLSRDDAGNILYVTVPIRSAINKSLYVDYRVTFFDQNGQQLNQTTWLSKTLEANTPDRIQVNALGPRAADFQIDFRYSR